MLISVLTPTIRPEGLKVLQEGLKNQTFQDFEWLVEVSIPERGHDLNAAYNRMLKRAKGSLVVSLQDYIQIPPDYLEKWWQAYSDHPDTFFTAPVGKVKAWGDAPVWDWRKSATECHWTGWEIDSGAAPLKALVQIGGFDEMLDGKWSSDNVNVGCRADLAGYKFRVVDNPSVAFDHDAHMPHPFRAGYDTSFNNQRLEEFRHGRTLKPLKVQ